MGLQNTYATPQMWSAQRTKEIIHGPILLRIFEKVMDDNTMILVTHRLQQKDSMPKVIQLKNQIQWIGNRRILSLSLSRLQFRHRERLQQRRPRLARSEVIAGPRTWTQ